MGRECTLAASAPAIWRGSVEKALRLDAGALIRAVRAQHPELWARWSRTGEATLLPLSVLLTRGGGPAGEAGVMLALDGTRAAAELPNGDAVALVALPTNLPGLRRWWWRCPWLGHAGASLYLPPGADGFASRQAHGLRYRSLSERPAERAAHKARKLRVQLGDVSPVLGGRLPDMPLRMRWPTYTRLCDAIREAEERALSFPPRMLARIAAAGA